MLGGHAPCLQTVFQLTRLGFRAESYGGALRSVYSAAGKLREYAGSGEEPFRIQGPLGQLAMQALARLGCRQVQQN